MAETSKYTISLSAPATLTATLGAGKINVNDYTLTVEEAENGVKLTLTRGSKTETVFIPNGAKGDKGDKGDTGAKGDKGDTGAHGPKGDKGDDGYSPAASVSKSGTTTTISITDKTGTTTATVEDGAKGDKGDPGSDASVTAENVQSALGYMPVAPTVLDEKQNVLKDADKQAITKIGMTSGAAWTAAEQKSARERMGVGKAYELIEVITTDGTSIVERSQEPDGTAYNFTAIKVVITSPKNLPASETIYARAFCGGQSTGSYVAFGENANYYKRSTFTWRIENSTIIAYATKPTILYSAQNNNGCDYSEVVMTPDVIITNGNIAKCMVYCGSIGNATPMSAGYLIKVYGVRA